MAPIVDQKEQATEYLKKYRILQLFEELGAYLVLDKPTEPEEYMIKKLKEVQEARRKKQALTLFNEEDISTMFSMFDPTGKGYVSPEQYKQAMVNFGVDAPKLKVPSESKIGRKTFESNMLTELLNRSLTK